VTDPSGAPLSGVRVVAVEHSVAAPLCTRILAELGADVIKIERPPGGDFSRHWDGYAGGEGAQFWWLNRHKRSVVLDLKSEEGRGALHELLGRADVFVQNLAPASAERLGLGPEQLESRYPDVISCHLSGYGSTGATRDRKAYDMLIQAEAGVMSLTGTPDRPMRVGVSIADVSAGLYSALSILAALLEKRQTGRVRTLDVAMFDVVLEFLGPMLVSFLNAGKIFERTPDQHHAIAPYGVFTAGDGMRVLIAVEQDSEWERFCVDVLEAPELAADPRLATNQGRLAHRDEIRDAVQERFAQRDLDDLVRALEEAGVAYGRLNDVGAVATHDVVRDRGVLAETEAAEAAVRHPVGLIQRLFETHPTERLRPPALGEDTQSVLAELSTQQSKIPPPC
jgi:itaconate CoA-transferase